MQRMRRYSNFGSSIAWTLAFVLVMLMPFLAANVLADEIRVKSFSMQMEPMTVDMQRKDNNGEVCALVKVIIPTAQATFEGNLIGRSDYKTSEYWCYLSPGSKQLKVKYPNCEPLMVNFEDLIGSGLHSKQIYELSLSVPTSHVTGGFPVRGTVKLLQHEDRKATKEELRKGLHVYKNYNWNEGTSQESVDLSQAPFGTGDYTNIVNFKLDNVNVGDTLLFESALHESVMFVMTDENAGKEVKVSLPLKEYDVGGTVLDEITGKPIPGIAIKLKNPRHTGGYVERTTDENGRFRFVSSHVWGERYCIINANDTIYPVKTSSAWRKGYHDLSQWSDSGPTQYFGLRDDNIITLRPYQLGMRVKNIPASDLSNLTLTTEAGSVEDIKVDDNGNFMISPFYEGMTAYLRLPGYKTVKLIITRQPGNKAYSSVQTISMKKGDPSEIIEKKI